MLKKLRRYWWSKHTVLIPKNREEFEAFASKVLDTFDLEDSKKNRDLMASMTFRLDFKYCEIVPKFYFDSIHRLEANEMLYAWAKEMKEAEDAEKKKKIDETKMSLLKQSETEEEAPEVQTTYKELTAEQKEKLYGRPGNPSYVPQEEKTPEVVTEPPRQPLPDRVTDICSAKVSLKEALGTTCDLKKDEVPSSK